MADRPPTRIPEDPAAFIRANTRIHAPPLVPEIGLHLASEVVPLWQMTEEELAAANVAPPYWAFAWAGGQAISRFLLDNPDRVQGKRVVDFAAGSGLGAIAAMKAGARAAIATDIDPFAIAAIGLNAAHNGVMVDIAGDLLDQPLPGCDLLLLGDICYEQPLAGRVEGWARSQAARGITVLLGDPGRTYVPKGGLHALATYSVPTSRELEDLDVRRTVVYQLLPGA